MIASTKTARDGTTRMGHRAPHPQGLPHLHSTKRLEMAVSDPEFVLERWPAWLQRGGRRDGGGSSHRPEKRLAPISVSEWLG
jgi:hypothetical protein